MCTEQQQPVHVTSAVTMKSSTLHLPVQSPAHKPMESSVMLHTPLASPSSSTCQETASRAPPYMLREQDGSIIHSSGYLWTSGRGAYPKSSGRDAHYMPSYSGCLESNPSHKQLPWTSEHHLCESTEVQCLPENHQVTIPTLSGYCGVHLKGPSVLFMRPMSVADKHACLSTHAVTHDTCTSSKPPPLASHNVKGNIKCN